MLEAMIAIWTRDPVKFEGQFYHIPESKIGPKPAQQPRPPIYLAGFGQYAFDRIAKFADGWNPAAIRDFEGFEAQVNQLQETAKRASVTLDIVRGWAEDPLFIAAIGWLVIGLADNHEC